MKLNVLIVRKGKSPHWETEGFRVVIKYPSSNHLIQEIEKKMKQFGRKHFPELTITKPNTKWEANLVDLSVFWDNYTGEIKTSLLPTRGIALAIGIELVKCIANK